MGFSPRIVPIATGRSPQPDHAEVMPGFNVGNCRLVLDGKDRPYVIWRTSVKANFPVLMEPAGPADDNLVYRVLDGTSRRRISTFSWTKTPSPRSPPGTYTQFNQNPPKILGDAHGKPHVIVLNTGGEHPSFADWVPGADTPTKIMSAPTPKGTLLNFQAFQGPHGKMAALMQTTANGQREEGDTWLSTSDGGGQWSAPQCITGNAARATGQHTDNSVAHGVTTAQVFGPGPGAVAFNKNGHMYLALVNVRVGSFGQDVGGAAYGMGSSSTPQLFFYKP